MSPVSLHSNALSLRTGRWSLCKPSTALVFAILACHCITATHETAAAEPLSADALFQTDKLVDIKITLAPEDWDEIRRQSRSFVESLKPDAADSPFTYVRGDIEINGQRIPNVGIRKKGFLGSLNNDRPSLKVKFEEYQKQSPFDGIDRLTLNNNNQDPSRLLQVLTYKFFNDSGTRASRCNLAKVSVNGKDLGIYSNVESIKRPFLERTFGDGSGSLFEGTVADFYPDFMKRFEKKNSAASRKQLSPIVDILAAETLDVRALEEHLDIDAFNRFWAAESLVGFWDGYTNNQNNFFLYRAPSNQKFYFIPWGTDSSFTEGMPLPPFRIFPKSVHSQSILANRLYRHPETRERYLTTLKTMLSDSWSEDRLLAEVDELESLIEDHVLEENKKFSSQLRVLRNFIERRRKNLEREFDDGPPELKTFAKQPPFMQKQGQVEAQFEGLWFDQTPAKPETLGKVTMTVEMDGQPVEIRQVGVYSEKNKDKKQSEDGVRNPTVVLTFQRAKDGKTFILGVGCPARQFHPTGDEPLRVDGILLDKGLFGLFIGSEFKFVTGTLNLDSAGMTDGDPVIGSISVSIFQIAGGKPIDK